MGAGVIVGGLIALGAGVLIGRSTRRIAREVCECPSCGYTEEKEIGIPCTTKTCPNCGTPLKGIRCI